MKWQHRSPLQEDISDRQQLIQDYRRTGYLDRQKAINKIMELRYTDGEVAAITIANNTPQSIPLVSAPDQGLVSELELQIKILSKKVLQ